MRSFIRDREEEGLPNSNFAFTSLYLFILIFFVLLSKISTSGEPNSGLRELVSSLQSNQKHILNSRVDELVVLTRQELHYNSCILDEDKNIEVEFQDLVTRSILYLRENKINKPILIKLDEKEKCINIRELTEALNILRLNKDAKFHIEAKSLDPLKSVGIYISLNES
ncbi:MAG: hypothetical protein SFT91_05775 [Rickettsiaceae bacterium]|nr:hypothetical protein [Rickettsiaceae bacterium]